MVYTPFDDTNPTVQDLPPIPQDDSAPATMDTPPSEEAVEAPKQDAAREISSEERNFRNLRMKAERLEKERNEAMERLRAYESQAPEEPEFDLRPNDLAEGKHLNKVQNKIQVLESQLIETRLRAQYPDIDSVVSADNLATLQRDYPELANTIGSSKNLYSKAVSAYTILKKLGIHADSGPYEQDKAIAQKNAAKPKPMASISPQQGDSPLSHANAFANGLTDDIKRKLHQEMMAAIKNR